MHPLFQTTAGELFLGKCEEVLKSINQRAAGKVQLILTAPPFPLKRKKRYGNFTGKAYIEWLSKLAPTFAELLTDDGSIVIELGNAWEPKQPVQSLLPLKSLLAFVENRKANLKLCQEFICFNPARLPSPAQWVTSERIRAKDSFTSLWWMAKTTKSPADNTRVLKEYSKAMKELLARQDYNSGKRPSEHVITEKGWRQLSADTNTSSVDAIGELDEIHEREETSTSRHSFSAIRCSRSSDNRRASEQL